MQPFRAVAVHTRQADPSPVVPKLVGVRSGATAPCGRIAGPLPSLGPPFKFAAVYLTVRAASDLRSQGLRTRTVSVKLRDADFTTRQASRTLPEAVVADRVLFETARELLDFLSG